MKTQNPQWEYIETHAGLEGLNKLGSVGWECYGVTVGQSQIQTYYLKRKVVYPTTDFSKTLKRLDAFERRSRKAKVLAGCVAMGLLLCAGCHPNSHWHWHVAKSEQKAVRVDVLEYHGKQLDGAFQPNANLFWTNQPAHTNTVLKSPKQSTP